MIPKASNARHRFKQLEQKLTYAVFGDLAMFIITLVAAGNGISWLKIIAGILTLAGSAAGCGFLVLINEHRRSRSLWIMVAFGSILVCTLVSLITGYPAPKIG